jgi:RNA polymerase sigma factor (TIGR02999 family)
MHVLSWTANETKASARALTPARSSHRPSPRFEPFSDTPENASPRRTGELKKNEVTVFLNALSRDGSQSTNELIPFVYQELRRLAAGRLAREASGQTLQATALVHEAYLRLAGGKNPQQWNNRGHFFGAAAEAMRRILVENARRKSSQKRGAGAAKVELSEVDLAAESVDDRILAVNDALEKLAAEDSLAAELVKLRFFAGLSGQQAAAALGLAERTATRLWAFGRAWLYRELQQA